MEEEFDSVGKSLSTVSWSSGKEQHTRRLVQLVAPHCEPPKGLCYKYWKTGSCAVKQRCKFLHVRNPKVSI